MTKTIIQFDINALFDGPASDQLRETVEQVNLRLMNGTLNESEAWRLVMSARGVEICVHYFGLPRENGSAQTLNVEFQRSLLMSQARK